MASQKLLGLPPVPPELKSTTTYLQRAEELKVQDPVVAYWCAYYAAQVGIGLKTKDTQSRDFLFSLLTTLERLKREIGSNDAIDNETVSAAYVENFALRVFVNVDNEDRKGAATRATAKKFLAAANFLEVLRTFPKTELSDTNEERIRYAKWKAADIAKAFREGRQPTPGPLGGSPMQTAIDPTEPLISPPPGSSPQTAQHLRHGSITPPTGLPPPPANYPYQIEPQVSPHYAQQFSGNSPADVSMAWSTTANVGVTDPGSSPFNQAFPHDSRSDRRSPSRSPNGSIRGSPSRQDPQSKKAWVSDELENPRPPLPPHAPTSGSPPRSPPRIDTKKTVHFTPSVVGGLSADGSPPLSAAYATAGESPRDEDFGVKHGRPQVPPHVPAAQPSPPVIHPYAPVVSGSPPRAPDLPHSWSNTNLPPSAPQDPSSFQGPPVPPYPHNFIVPPLPPPLPQPVAPPPPPAATPPPPLELTVQMVTKAQKHCRYAISALDYDDAETARKELRAALALLGG